MANLLSNIVYVSLEDLRDTTSIVGLKNLTDDLLWKTITTAQYIIDDYLWYYGCKFVATQDFIFPIDVDWVETLPTDIQIATVLVCEQIYLKWYDRYEWSYEIKEEKSWPDSVVFWMKRSDFISNKAKSIIIKYKNSFFKEVI